MSYKLDPQKATRLKTFLAAALTLACAFSSAAHAMKPATANSAVPAVPPDLRPPGGNQVFLTAAAVGTQNYLCLPSGWTAVGPQATLFVTLQWMNTSIRQQVATHFLSPNPAEGGTPRPTWQSSFDTSIVWANPIASSTDPDYVDPSAVAWLLLQAVGAQNGPTGGSSLSQTTFIQRINTSGGLMPTTACTVGARVFVPYTADYVFYRKAGN